VANLIQDNFPEPIPTYCSGLTPLKSPRSKGWLAGELGGITPDTEKFFDARTTSGKLNLESVVGGGRGRGRDRVPFYGQFLPDPFACRVGGFPCPLLAFERLEAKDFGSTGHDLIMHAGSNGSLI
jgi:hypothetical protein